MLGKLKTGILYIYICVFVLLKKKRKNKLEK